jgi:tetratricopeptide (TPR) repeat protein
VKLLAASGQSEAIEPLLEARAKAILAGASSSAERVRIARTAADLYSGVQNHAAAERWYRLAVEEEPAQFPALALTLMRQGRAREAIALCRSAAERDRTSRPFAVLASILVEGGAKTEHVQLAEALLDGALARFKDDADLLYSVGMLRIVQDRYADGVGLLQKVLKIAPRHVPALNNLAVILAESPDRRGEALVLIDKAIEIRGQQSTLLDTKGAILVSSSRSKDAVALLEAAARDADRDPRHRFHLAMAYFDLGIADKAREQFNAALSEDLEKQILTPTDRKLIERLRTTLQGQSL